MRKETEKSCVGKSDREIRKERKSKRYYRRYSNFQALVSFSTDKKGSGKKGRN